MEAENVGFNTQLFSTAFHFPGKKKKKRRKEKKTQHNFVEEWCIGIAQGRGLEGGLVELDNGWT